MLLQEFQHALHFSACLKTLVFSDMIHELKMSEKIIYIYIFWQIRQELPGGFVWQVLILINGLFRANPLYAYLFL